MLIRSLATIAPALNTYGIDRSHTFRPTDFINAGTRSDESMIRILTAVIIHGSEKGVPSHSFPLADGKGLLASEVAAAANKRRSVDSSRPTPTSTEDARLLSALKKSGTATSSSPSLLNPKPGESPRLQEGAPHPDRKVTLSRNPSTASVPSLSVQPGKPEAPKDTAPADPAMVVARSLAKTEGIEATNLKVYNMIAESGSKLRHTLQGILQTENRKQEKYELAARATIMRLDRAVQSLATDLESLTKRATELDAVQRDILDKIATPALAVRIAGINHLPSAARSAADAEEDSDDDDSASAHDADSVSGLSRPRLQIPERLRSQMSTDSIASDGSQISSVDMTTFLKGPVNRLSGEVGAITAAGVAGSPGGTPTTPKMFQKLPPEALSANLPKSELMRLCAVYELIDTEADYVRDLNVMISVCCGELNVGVSQPHYRATLPLLPPDTLIHHLTMDLRSEQFHKEQIRQTKMLPEEDITALFSNIDQLVPVNQQLLKRLNEKKEAEPLIAEVGQLPPSSHLRDALVDVSEVNGCIVLGPIGLCISAISFKVYTTYCANYPNAMKLVHQLQARPDIKEQLQHRHHRFPQTAKRLTSPPATQELQKHTDKNSKDTISLNLAMEKIEAVVSLVNEGTRQLGEKERIITMQSKIESPMPLNLGDKKHLRDGMLMRMQNGKSKERHVLLFTDVLLVCKPVKTKYQLEAYMNLSEMSIKADGRGDAIPKGAKFAFQVLVTSERRETLVFGAHSEEERSKWVEAFQTGIKIAIEEARRSDRAEKRTSAGLSLAKHFSFQDADAAGLSGTLKKSGTMKKPMARSPSQIGSAMGGGNFMKGKAWGGSMKKRGVDFAAELTIYASEGDDREKFEPDEFVRAASYLLEGRHADAPRSFPKFHPMQAAEPEMVTANGQIWKRATSAMGSTYY
ncbi:hypothetical protein BDK51DRAFT_40719 [Blyttiomyces helicus]|uniref:PH domain-containing protein n=1 Tax=Blyttiomyces helicus TaxID=388810 RepID=A0A4P9WL50_9FUNG|nr:hypothetical protein BDK51DRAFT_40719 [Blyttiomyces helicus]|eukprot:RKO93574.1 hypothetical protein BDK51DRAFT_40719 [Blyttiomyces helicus]